MPIPDGVIPAEKETEEQAAATARAALEAAPVFDGPNDTPGQLRSRRSSISDAPPSIPAAKRAPSRK